MVKQTLSQSYISDGRLAADFNAKVGKYYIIEDDINIPADGVDFPPDSVLEFRGGSFYHGLTGKEAIKPPTVAPNPPETVANAAVRLNGSTVSSPVYCIFQRSVNVTGFINSLVHADWFRDYTATEGEEVYINRALRAARNCPVTLERRTYILKGSITFPYGTDIADNKYNSNTLISPGILKLDVTSLSTAAIVVNKHYINLDINRISGTVNSNDVRGGVGIRFIGDSFHCNIKVGRMAGLHKGFEIVPSVSRPGQPQSDGGIQYCRIEFQHIEAKYCFYVDIYKGKESGYITWFNENRILGGELSGVFGIYMVDEPDNTTFIEDGYAPMDGLVFENIGFEELDDIPLKICNVKGCKFNNLRLMEANTLPSDKPWIVLRNVSYTDISLKGQLNPDLISIDPVRNRKNHMRGVIIETWVKDDGSGYNARFNRMAVMPDKDGENTKGKPTLIAYNSIIPSNMAKTLIVGSESKTYDYDIQDILPEREISDARFNVLPRTLNVIMEGTTASLDVTGLRNFAPCIFDIYLYAPNGNKKFEIKTLEPGFQITNATVQPSRKGASMLCTATGLYRLTFDSEWSLVVTRIN